MGEPVEERGGHLGVTEDRGPPAEGQVGGDDDRGLLIKAATGRLTWRRADSRVRVGSQRSIRTVSFQDSSGEIGSRDGADLHLDLQINESRHKRPGNPLLELPVRLKLILTR